MRRDVVDLGSRLEQLERDLQGGVREMVTMGPDGAWDALLEVRPLGESGRVARDLVMKAYIEGLTFEEAGSLIQTLNRQDAN